MIMYKKFTKRIIDILVATFLLVILFPISLLIAVAIKLEDNGNVFFLQKRLGKNGKHFNIIKFRTMHKNSDQIEVSLSPELLNEYYREFKLEDDPRTTHIGKVLRRTCMDEIPQLINVLKNDLSIVGPRPIVDKEKSFYNEYELKMLLSVKPGITGYWQTYGRKKASYSDKSRQKSELYYVKNYSLVLDLKIIINTIVIILNEILSL